MFKSALTKYMTAFMLIVLVSFLLVFVIITSIIGTYSENAKADLMKNALQTSAAYLEHELGESGGLSLLVKNEEEKLRTVLTHIASGTDDLTVLVSDAEGGILLAAGSEAKQIAEGERIPATAMSWVAGNESVAIREELLEGIFEDAHLICAMPVGGESGGVVFLCSSSVMMVDLLKLVTNSMLVAIVGVLLAALIAVYIISGRVLAPLKDISRAAKEYAAGKFGTRVAVRGVDEVAELAVAFNNMAESLDNYDTMQSTFMSNVSHDLRSPMTSIAGFIDGILDGAIPPDKHTYYLGQVSSEIKRLSRLVASLLDLSRIQAGERKFTPVAFDICEMGRQILFTFEQKIDEKRLDVDFDFEEDNLLVHADRDAIYQVLYNLCDNAVKFSSEGGLLRMEVKHLKNRKVKIGVYNEGQGIAKSDLPHVFDRFYKSDKSRGLNKSGVGLGLFISKTIIEAHKQTIWVESEEGKSCSFFFTLTAE